MTKLPFVPLGLLWLAVVAVAACAPPETVAPSAQAERKPSPSSAGSAPRSPAPAPRVTKGPVVVALVVDQFSAWVAEERIPALPADGGFARLVRQGTWVRAMRYPYAVTDTAPGHAALHTGRPPSESGIAINEIPDEKTGHRSSVFIDPETKLVTPSGTKDVPGRSAKQLKVPTVADRLREARPDARIVSVSLKDRAALLPAGKKPTHALWFDSQEHSFVTSTAIEATFPKWAVPIADRRAVQRAMALPWEPTDAAWLARVGGKDDAPGEGNLDGLGVVFPHHATTSAAFRSTPATDTMILDLALAAAVADRRDDVPLLLLVSLSTNDVIGHVFGPDSWEAWDHFRKLDAALGRFFDSLEQAVGPFGVLLSGDHGNVSMPEARLPFPAFCKDPEKEPTDPHERPRCIRGARLEPEALRNELRAESARVLGRADFIAGLADGYVFLTREARAATAARGKLDGVVRRVMLEKHKDEVAAVFDTRDLTKQCPGVLASARGVPARALPGEDLLALVCRSWAAAPDSGDYCVVPKRGSFFDGEIVPGKGSSHGTPYLYDRTVPLFVRTAGRDVDAGRVVTEPVDFTAYAALETALLGLDTRSPHEIIDALTAR